MPEAAYLHIRASDEDPVRVVGLSGAPVRIGRAASCEVRLYDPEIPDEACRLRRLGRSWQLTPGRVASAVWLEGRKVDSPRLINYGTSFRVGVLTLTLQPADVEVSPWAKSPSSSADALSHPSPEDLVASGAQMASSHRAEWESRTAGRDRWLEAHRGTKRWESKLRAAAEKLRARDSGGVSSPVHHQPVARPEPPPLRSATPINPPSQPTPRPAQARTTTRPAPAAVAPRRPQFTGPSIAALSGTVLPARTRIAPVEPVPSPPTRRADEAATDHIAVPPPAVPIVEPEPREACIADESERAEPVVETAVETDYEPVAPLASIAEWDDLGTIEQAIAEHEEVIARAEPLAEVIEPTPQPAQVAPDIVADEDDDDELYDASEEFRPDRVLGTVRQGPATPRRETQASPDPRPERSTHSEPVAHHDAIVNEPPSPPPSRSRNVGWSYQGPFVADTNLDLPTIEPQARAASGRVPNRPSAPVDHGIDRHPVGRPAAESTGPRSSRDWPTVADILNARAAIPPRSGTAGKRRGVSDSSGQYNAARTQAAPSLTVPAEPGQWRMPLWLAWLPALGVIGIAVAGTGAGLLWSRDAYHAGIVATRLKSAEKVQRPLPKGVEPGTGRWWESSAPHLITWAAYLDRITDDPAKADEARDLLAKAAQLSPLNPTVRHALARTLPGQNPTAAEKLALALGQSRDVLTLAWAGHQLLEAGHKEAALGAYGRALAMAAEPDLDRAGAPVYLDEAQPKRYALPTEERLAAVIRDMAGASAWGYRDWSAALPKEGVALLAAARVLREAGSADAHAALDVALEAAGTLSPAITGAEVVIDPPADPREALRLAAAATALSMKQKWQEARDAYRQAIDRMPSDRVRRSWWFNVADLELRMNDESERRLALESAKNADPKDEITLRVVEIQKASGVVAQRGGTAPVRTPTPGP